jgi:hypothetical protein
MSWIELRLVLEILILKRPLLISVLRIDIVKTMTISSNNNSKSQELRVKSDYQFHEHLT